MDDAGVGVAAVDGGALLAAYDEELRRGVRAGPGVRVERDAYGVVRQTNADGGWTGVVWADLDAGTADAAIAAQVRHYAGLGRGFEWKLYSHDRPADLGRRLLAAGLTAEPRETVMVAAVAGLSTAVVLPEGVRLRRVADAEGVELMAAAHDEVFGAGRLRLRDELLRQLAEAPETLEAVVVLAGERPVCAARLELPRGTRFAGLWGGGTVPEWRGRGIYRALVAHRAGLAAARGYTHLHVDASDDSRPVLRRLGFVPLATTTPYVYGS
ncbi:GNAT family N-acetyltransferase [Streptomyces sp. Z26]|uniref:GNAT family N-acetyltransferase n=1 Tax=Streptomyces sp. Z26 TaxID=2500177 RepID=UPI001F0CB757|nr:GNAT family N-acetyltransferase [Streptomyces sp. Z26]